MRACIRKRLPRHFVPRNDRLFERKTEMKKVILILGIVLIFIVGFFLVKGKFGKSGEVTPTPAAISTSIALPENQEKGVEVSLTPRSDKRAVTLKVSKISKDTVSIEYELSYDTGSGLPRGVLGKAQIKGTDSLSREILLGSCSKNVCVYDEGVTKISLTLKFNKSSGQATGFSKEYEL